MPRVPALGGAIVAVTAIASAAHATQSDPFADALVAWSGTLGPNPFWSDPSSLLGSPNTLDYDDGTFFEGPMRRIHLAWPAWRWGSSDPADLGAIPPLAGRRQNGVSLTAGASIVVAFDDPVENNPPDGGRHHWGLDLIIHGNTFFQADRTVTLGLGLDDFVITGDVFTESVTVEVAQSADGPWFLAGVADTLWPTNPWLWDAEAATWSAESADWTKPVDPGIDAADAIGLTGAAAAAIYVGSAGGTAFDLDDLTDPAGLPASLPWITHVRLSDPLGNGGEVCGLVDVSPGPGGCNPADINADDVLTFADVSGFIAAFNAGNADINGDGTTSFGDVSSFIAAFNGGCP